MPTVLLVVFTAVLGAFLLRLQGLHTLARMQVKLDSGEIPAEELVSGVILLLAGALLLTPGFFTDIIGFLCLLPQIRSYIAAKTLAHLAVHIQSGRQSGTVIVEGEYWEEDNSRHLR